MIMSDFRKPFISIIHKEDDQSRNEAPKILFHLLHRHRHYECVSGIHKQIHENNYIFFLWKNVKYVVGKVGKFVPGTSIYFCSINSNTETWSNLSSLFISQLTTEIEPHLFR